VTSSYVEALDGAYVLAVRITCLSEHRVLISELDLHSSILEHVRCPIDLEAGVVVNLDGLRLALALL